MPSYDLIFLAKNIRLIELASDYLNLFDTQYDNRLLCYSVVKFLH